ncbi:substrate-binding domain-containing protein [Chitinilyticum litopenaei]|uniref:substrate-binding domain-containing protein n=1 Tax=Chitinilyticum litopenaei TaxID=1121276 RepID=UPI0004028C1D|nr:substrate-binding domain-containing protein [Chitinilyticum litopenaei]
MTMLHWLRPLLASLLVLAGGGSTLAADPPPARRIGISIATLGNPFFVALLHGMQEGIRQHSPGAQMLVRSADYDAPKQIAQIEELLAQNVELLLVSAAAEGALTEVLRKARTQGVVVIAVDVRAQGANQTVMTDNVLAGRMVCEHLAKTLKGQGRVVIQNGPNVSSVIDRVAGCKSALAQFPGIKLLSDRENGLGSVWGGHQAMQQAQKKHAPIDAVFAINDRQALGSLQYLRERKLERVLIGSVDGSDAVVKQIAAGSQIVASASQSPATMGRRAAEQGLGWLGSSSIDRDTELLPPTLVHRDNAATFAAWDAAPARK